MGSSEVARWLYWPGGAATPTIDSANAGDPNLEMFSKILIANRGEIAVRIIKTCRRHGHRHRGGLFRSRRRQPRGRDGRRDRLHRPAAGRAILPRRRQASSPPASETGAEAVHPGFGFLSENAGSRGAAASGHRLHRPEPARHRRPWATRSSPRSSPPRPASPTCRATAARSPTPRTPCAIAEEIGYPVMIKASAGGGGKGIRVAYAARRSRRASPPCRAEAKGAFGDDRIFIEKFIENPRHIEIQVLGDKHGHVVHLFERECSIQRRNQKVIEEAPSPLLDPETRAAMGAQAVALAQAVGYDSAGTVEFVAGQDKSFYFLEMNTRLQVEHPGDRADHGRRPGRADDPRRGRRAAGRSPRTTSPSTAGRSRAASMPRTPTAASCPPSAACRAIAPPAEGEQGELRCATTPACARATRSPSSTTR